MGKLLFFSVSLVHLRGSYVSSHVLFAQSAFISLPSEPVSHLYGAAPLWIQCLMHMVIQAHLGWSRGHGMGELVKDLTLTSE